MSVFGVSVCFECEGLDLCRLSPMELIIGWMLCPCCKLLVMSYSACFLLLLLLLTPMHEQREFTCHINAQSQQGYTERQLAGRAVLHPSHKIEWNSSSRYWERSKRVQVCENRSVVRTVDQSNACSPIGVEAILFYSYDPKLFWSVNYLLGFWKYGNCSCVYDLSSSFICFMHVRTLWKSSRPRDTNCIDWMILFFFLFCFQPPNYWERERENRNMN